VKKVQESGTGEKSSEVAPQTGSAMQDFGSCPVSDSEKVQKFQPGESSVSFQFKNQSQIHLWVNKKGRVGEQSSGVGMNKRGGVGEQNNYTPFVHG